MKVRKSLLIALAGWAGLAAPADAPAQAPALPGAALPGAAPPLLPGAAVPGTPPPATFLQKLGLSKEQKEACKRQLCATPLGQLINNSKAPLTALTGGLIPPFCPTTPSAADLADPGAVGAAAAIMADEAAPSAAGRRPLSRHRRLSLLAGSRSCSGGRPRGDRNECVRLEAALALGSGCCCTKKTIEALTIVVSCSDRDGAPKETSYRVHTAAAAALDHCLACYAKVDTTAPKEKPPVEGVRPPVEGSTPPPPPAPETAAAKPIDPGQAKPARGLASATPPPAPVKRPVGPAYYAHIAKAPLAAILAETRRVAEKYHLRQSSPIRRSRSKVIRSSASSTMLSAPIPRRSSRRA